MNPTTKAHTSAQFQLLRDQWLQVKSKRDNHNKRITSKVTLIKSRQKRLENVQRTIQNDILKLQTEVQQLEQFIILRDEEMQETEQAMFVALGGAR